MARRNANDLALPQRLIADMGSYRNLRPTLLLEEVNGA
jgi:hypothetical protein